MDRVTLGGIEASGFRSRAGVPRRELKYLRYAKKFDDDGCEARVVPLLPCGAPTETEQSSVQRLAGSEGAPRVRPP